MQYVGSMESRTTFWNCADDLQIVLRKRKYMCFVFQLQLGAWVFHPIHCSCWCIWCLCTVHDILWGWEVCWLLQNVKYSRLKTFKVTECVCVCLYVCEEHFHTCYCIFGNRKFVTYYCMIWNAHNFFMGCCFIWNTGSYAVYHTVTVHISDRRSAVAIWQ